MSVSVENLSKVIFTIRITIRSQFLPIPLLSFKPNLLYLYLPLPVSLVILSLSWSSSPLRLCPVPLLGGSVPDPSLVETP